MLMKATILNFFWKFFVATVCFVIFQIFFIKFVNKTCLLNFFKQKNTLHFFSWNLKIFKFFFKIWVLFSIFFTFYEMFVRFIHFIILLKFKFIYNFFKFFFKKPAFNFLKYFLKKCYFCFLFNIKYSQEVWELLTTSC